MQHPNEDHGQEPAYGVTWEESAPVSEEVRRYERIAAELAAETDRLRRADQTQDDDPEFGEPMTQQLPPLAPTREQIHQPTHDQTPEPEREGPVVDDAQEQTKESAPARSPRRPRRANRRPVGPVVRAHLAQAGVSSAYYARRGLAQHAQTAAEWIRAEDLEEHIRTRAEAARAEEIRKAQISHTKQLNQLARESGKRGSVATASIAAPQMPREVSETSITGKAWLARARRGLVCLAVPTGLVALPPWLALDAGAWWTLAAWPITYGYLAWHGWVYRDTESAPPKVKVPEPRDGGRRGRGVGASIIGATPEEAALLDRLTRWDELARGRGMSDIVPGTPTADESGLLVPLDLGGKWTPAKLVGSADQVRALLAVPDETLLQINPGGQGDRVQMRIRTRRRELDTVWAPDREGLGVDVDTAEVVSIPDDARMVVCGASGSGKSWALRSYMARIVASGKDHLVYIDGKGEESVIWRGKCRVAVGRDEIKDVVAELSAEMHRRMLDMERRGITVWDGPMISVVVDEGRVVLSLRDKEMIQQLIDISSLGRSRGVVLRWCTQYPTTSGDAPGIHPQIKANVDALFCLRVKAPEHARVALDEDADYGPQHIHRDDRGLGYLGGYGPTPIQTWLVNDKAVKALPDRAPWSQTEDGAADQQAQGEAGDIPEVLALALEMSEGFKGLPSEMFFEVASERLGLMDFDVTKVFREHGIEREPGPFQTGQGRARGWRREAIEKGTERYRR